MIVLQHLFENSVYSLILILSFSVLIFGLVLASGCLSCKEYYVFSWEDVLNCSGDMDECQLVSGIPQFSMSLYTFLL